MAITEAILEALRFQERSTERLRALDAAAWGPLLDWCDRRQMTFVLEAECGDDLPDHVRRRMAVSRERYSLRYARLEHQLVDIIDVLDRSGVQFAVLKGMTHSPDLTPHPILRAQGDIDLWCPHGAAAQARGALAAAGYRSTGNSVSDRHLPPMALPSGWQWRGDIFDPEMPVRVEIHHDLWRSESEYIPIPGEDGFSARLQLRDIAGRSVRVLCPQDLLGFAALHLLLHLLHGDLPLQRAWEIARFLHLRADDEQFWAAWNRDHGPEVRLAEAVAFQIVAAWFRCRVADCVQQEIEALPASVRLWLERFTFSPLTDSRRPNKDELWLHLALIPSLGGRVRVLLRRLFPLHASRGRMLSGSRLRRHATTLGPTLVQGLRWYGLLRSNQS